MDADGRCSVSLSQNNNRRDHSHLVWPYFKARSFFLKSYYEWSPDWHHLQSNMVIGDPCQNFVDSVKVSATEEFAGCFRLHLTY